MKLAGAPISWGVCEVPDWGLQLEPERVLADLDTGHIALGGADPLDVAERAGDRVRHVHVKDVEPTLGPRVRDRAIDYAPAVRGGLYCPLGEESARIADVLSLLRGRSDRGWYVLEQDVMLDAVPQGIPGWIENSVSFARAHA